MKQPSVYTKSIIKVTQGTFSTNPDLLVVEKPLEIRLLYKGVALDTPSETAICVTMRTPGNDEELAIGFLYTEGIITSIHDILSIKHCQQTTQGNKGNIIKVSIRPEITPDLSILDRNFKANSSCGVCGKLTIDQIACTLPRLKNKGFTISPDIIYSLPNKFLAAQQIFNHTGGIHAAALFCIDGKLVSIKEDIGRHNAIDKIIGIGLKKNILESENPILMSSSRIGYELIQKTAVAGIPILIAVGAPSSLAVQLADDIGMTLIGFLKNKSFNIYTAPWRVQDTKHQQSSQGTLQNTIIKT